MFGYCCGDRKPITPMARKSPPPGIAEAHAGTDPAAGALLRVAVVHAEEVTREGLRLVLERDGRAQVVQAEEKAAELLHAPVGPVQVVVFHLSAPWERALADVERMQDLPGKPKVVVLGNLTDRLVQEAVQAGAYGVLQCNAPCSELCRAVHTVGGGALHTNAWMLAFVGKRKRSRTSSVEPSLVKLTPMQAKVLYWLVKHPELSYAQIGKLHKKGARTIESHKTALLRKYGQPTRAALIKFALLHHLC